MADEQNRSGAQAADQSAEINGNAQTSAVARVSEITIAHAAPSAPWEAVSGTSSPTSAAPGKPTTLR